MTSKCHIQQPTIGIEISFILHTDYIGNSSQTKCQPAVYYCKFYNNNQ